MSRLKDIIFEDYDNCPEEMGDLEPVDVYPKKLHVDGYDVNHYYNGAVPVYEVFDKKGNIIDIAYSTNEMHEITDKTNEKE